MSTTTASSTTASTWDSVSGGSIPLNINDATSTTNTSYVYGDLLFGGTAPVEQITTTSSGTSVSYLVSNQTGVQGVYNGSGSSLGAVQEMAIYSVYGIQSISSGSKVTPFGFQGSYTDPTGLIYLINRYYDPTTDQFLSVDPDIASTNQPYVFTNDNPLNMEDPTGMCFGCFIFHDIASAYDQSRHAVAATTDWAIHHPLDTVIIITAVASVALSGGTDTGLAFAGVSETVSTAGDVVKASQITSSIASTLQACVHIVSASCAVSALGSGIGRELTKGGAPVFIQAGATVVELYVSPKSGKTTMKVVSSDPKVGFNKRGG